MKLTEFELELAIIELLGEEGYPHVPAHKLLSTNNFSPFGRDKSEGASLG